MTSQAATRPLHPLRLTWRCFAGAGDELFPVAVEEALQRASGVGWRIDPPDAYCHRCGVGAGPHSATAAGCPRCVDRRFKWNRFVRLGPYDEPLSQWIRAMKFAGAWTWASWIGARLADRLPPDPAGPVAVCPVPMHWRRRFQRGYNQTALIAQGIARRRRWPLVPAVRRARHSKPQTSVVASGRARNVRGCFSLESVDLTGWELWLVDDVMTTGSTLSACARLLKRAGARRVNVAVAAVSAAGAPRPIVSPH